MSLWRRTFFNLGQPEPIADPRVEEFQRGRALDLQAQDSATQAALAARRLALEQRGQLARERAAGVEQGLSRQDMALRAELGRGQLAQGQQNLEGEALDRALRAELGRGGLDVQRAGQQQEVTQNRERLAFEGRRLSSEETRAAADRAAADRRAAFDLAGGLAGNMLSSRTALEARRADMDFEAMQGELRRQDAGDVERARIARDAANAVPAALNAFANELQTNYPATDHVSDTAIADQWRNMRAAAARVLRGGAEGSRPPQTEQEVLGIYAGLERQLNDLRDRAIADEAAREENFGPGATGIDNPFEDDDRQKILARHNGAILHLQAERDATLERVRAMPPAVPDEGRGRSRPRSVAEPPTGPGAPGSLGIPDLEGFIARTFEAAGVTTDDPQARALLDMVRGPQAQGAAPAAPATPPTEPQPGPTSYEEARRRVQGRYAPGGAYDRTRPRR